MPAMRATPSGQPPDGSVIKSAERVFKVLELFRQVRTPLSVRAVAEHFGYPLSSTSVLMRSIALIGYLRYDQKQRAYFPTVRLALLGDWVSGLTSGGDALRPMLEELAQRTDEAIMLAVQNDIFSQYAEVIQSSHPLQVYFPPGTRRLLCVSGTGWAMLAGQSDEAIRKMVHRTNLRLDKNKPQIELQRLMSRLTQVRKQGYAFSAGVVTPGVGVIAMSLAPQAAAGMQLAVGIGGVLERVRSNETKLVKIMRSVLRKHGLAPP